MDREINIYSLQDLRLICQDCGTEFKFSIGEQRFFLGKHLATPKRCPKCREFRRLTIAKEGE